MTNLSLLLDRLELGEYDAALAPLPATRARALRAAEGLLRSFAPDSSASAALFSAPGRTELGGNHTDHQHGRVLCAAVNLDLFCCAAVNGTTTVRICAEGYAPIQLSLDSLLPAEDERGSSAALVRGVAAWLKREGFSPSGFDAYVLSGVPAGSGLSSSAAFEVLVGQIFNHFFCDGQISPPCLAAAGQYAENVYFGKPCGLMDQMACALGGISAIDFSDPNRPAVTSVDYDLSASGHRLCIVDTGSCHADLTDDYADITREMGAVAAHFGASVLREVPEEDFRAALPRLRQTCGDRAVLRALHFYAENQTAAAEAEALAHGDFPAFLSLVNSSGLSSSLLLQNTFSLSDPRQQAIPLALALGRERLGGSGAIRVHGGGFAGTVQAFVPEEKLEDFRSGMEAIFGRGCCRVLTTRVQGGCVVLP